MSEKYTGTKTDWANTFKIALKTELATLDKLNEANHLALENGQITMEHFQAAAQVLVNEIMKR